MNRYHSSITMIILITALSLTLAYFAINDVMFYISIGVASYGILLIYNYYQYQKTTIKYSNNLLKELKKIEPNIKVNVLTKKEVEQCIKKLNDIEELKQSNPNIKVNVLTKKEVEQYIKNSIEKTGKPYSNIKIHVLSKQEYDQYIKKINNVDDNEGK